MSWSLLILFFLHFSVSCLGEKIRAERIVIADEYLWKDAIIPYQWDENIFKVSSLKRAQLRLAMDIWENASCVQFVEWTGEETFVYITDSKYGPSVSFAIIGTTHTGNLTLGIAKDETLEGMVHNLGHVLGFQHTNQRIDRDLYIAERNSSAYSPQRRFKSTKVELNPLNTHLTPFDYDSVMLWPRYQFVSLKTNSSLKPLRFPFISLQDSENANALYKCPVCGGTLKLKPGTIRVVSANTSNNCEWRVRIESAKLQTIEIIVRKSEYSCSNCKYDLLTVYDTYRNQSKRLGSLHTSSKVPRIYASGTRFVINKDSSIDMPTGIYEIALMAFEPKTIKRDLHHLLINESCSQSVCAWDIAPRSEVLDLVSLIFEDTSQFNCTTNYVELVENYGGDKPKVTQICDTTNVSVSFDFLNISVLVLYKTNTIQSHLSYPVSFVVKRGNITDPCTVFDHGCSHWCIPLASETSNKPYECGCPPGKFRLDDDQKKCIEICYDFVDCVLKPPYSYILGAAVALMMVLIVVVIVMKLLLQS